MAGFVSPAWMPSSLREAARAGDATAADLESGAAWAHLLGKLQTVSETVLSDNVPRNPADMAAGFQHLLVLLWIGIDDACRRDSAPVLAVRPSNTDAVFKWGMDCPDCIYTGSGLRGGDTYRALGESRHRALRRPAVDGAAWRAPRTCCSTRSTSHPTATSRSSSRATSIPGNWMKIADDATQLVVRHFFYDWDTEVASSLSIEKLSGPPPAPRVGSRSIRRPRWHASSSRSVTSWRRTSTSSCSSRVPRAPNTFNPPFDGTAMGAAAENRPVMGSFDLAPDEALVVEVEPPQGLYWSYSIGNPWWETIDYARHQSSLNGHQAVVDDDGLLRVVIAHEDPGVANWLDTAGHSAGPVILRCVRTETAPVPTTRVVPFADVAGALPASTRRVSADERAAAMERRRIAVSRRFVR